MRILFWFRADLRLEDNTGLHEADRDARGDVVPFVLDEEGDARDRAPARVRFELESRDDLARAVGRAGSRLALGRGPAPEALVRAARRAGADAVYWNDLHEPALERRDDRVERALRGTGVGVRRFHDRLLVPPGAVLTRAGTPFVVYTPFRRACEALPPAPPLPAVRRLAPHRLPGVRVAGEGRPAPAESPWPGGAAAARARLARFVRHGLARYHERRDVPAAEATSRLSADLAAGTLSPRTLVAAVREAAADDPALRAPAGKLESELRWRDFYAHVLHHFPHCERGPFLRRYEGLAWRGDPAHLAAWRAGRTGVPLVDAGMRELAATGFMHNRLRMVVASFLAKDLLLDWRLGERHFARHLVDFDLASNNGGWQWAASTGTDAQPYFRVFNPVLQGMRHDPDGAYVRRWVPELARVPARWIHRPWEAPARVLAGAGVRLGRDYPERLVDHEEQREKALAMYREA